MEGGISALYAIKAQSLSRGELSYDLNVYRTKPQGKLSRKQNVWNSLSETACASWNCSRTHLSRMRSCCARQNCCESGNENWCLSDRFCG